MNRIQKVEDNLETLFISLIIMIVSFTIFFLSFGHPFLTGFAFLTFILSTLMSIYCAFYGKV